MLGGSDVRRLLPMADCIEAMEEVLRSHARARVVLPLRTVLPVAGHGSLYVMPAWTAEPESLAVKLITLFPGNTELGKETHQGIVVLFGADGAVEALIEGGSLTAIRTAAVSAVATRALSNPDASGLAILGSGVQAGSHFEAMCAVRPIRRVRVWSRTRANAAVFVKQLQESTGEVEIAVAESAREAVRGADIICTVTGSPTPVIESGWIDAGAHINAVGASTAKTRELDSETVARAHFYVDSREAALAEAGDLLIPLGEGRFGPDHIAAELGAVLVGSGPGRSAKEDITVFESLGLAIEDAAAARVLANRAAAETGLSRLAMD